MKMMMPPTGATQSLGNNPNAALNKPNVPSGNTGASAGQKSKGGKSPLKGLFAALRASKEHAAYKALGAAKGNGPSQKSTLADEAVGKGSKPGGTTAVSDPSSKGFNVKGTKPQKLPGVSSTKIPGNQKGLNVKGPHKATGSSASTFRKS